MEIVIAEFISNNWDNILLTLITTGALAICSWTWKQMKNYKALLEEKDNEAFDDQIDEKLAPIIEEIEKLREYIRKVDKSEQHKIDLIVDSYKFRLTQMCRLYIKQGFMTQDQYDQLSEFYKLYDALGGNGQAKQYYDRAIKLEIRDE